MDYDIIAKLLNVYIADSKQRESITAMAQEIVGIFANAVAPHMVRLDNYNMESDRAKYKALQAEFGFTKEQILELMKLDRSVKISAREAYAATVNSATKQALAVKAKK